MAELSPEDEFYSELQVAVLAVALTLPLIKLIEYLSARYFFVPSKPCCGEAQDDGPAEDDEHAVEGGRRLLAGLGIDESVDADGDAAAAAANAALETTMKIVLARRLELVDALEAETDPTPKADLKTLLKCHERAWACEPKGFYWRTRFARRTRARLIESIECFEAFAPGLEDDDPAMRAAALCQAHYASALPPGTERLVFRDGAGGAEAEPAPVAAWAKGLAFFVMALISGGAFYFMLFATRMMEGKGTAVMVDAAWMALLQCAVALIPLRIYFRYNFVPRAIRDRIAHVGDPFRVPRLKFRAPLPVEPSDLARAPEKPEKPSELPREAAPVETARQAVARAAKVAGDLAREAEAERGRVGSNRAHRASSRRWDPAHLARTADYESWSPPRASRSSIVLVGLFLALHLELQQTVVDELANVLLFLCILIGEVTYAGLGEQGPENPLFWVFVRFFGVCASTRFRPFAISVPSLPSVSRSWWSWSSRSGSARPSSARRGRSARSTGNSARPARGARPPGPRRPRRTRTTTRTRRARSGAPSSCPSPTTSTSSRSAGRTRRRPSRTTSSPWTLAFTWRRSRRRRSCSPRFCLFVYPCL